MLVSVFWFVSLVMKVELPIEEVSKPESLIISVSPEKSED